MLKELEKVIIQDGNPFPTLSTAVQKQGLNSSSASGGVQLPETEEPEWATLPAAALALRLTSAALVLGPTLM